MRYAKKGILVLAFSLAVVSVAYFLNPEGMLNFLSRNVYLYSGIMMAGGGAFGLAAIRVLWFKTESWYALLEAAMISGLVSTVVVFKDGNTAWIVPGWCALTTTLLSFYLRFFRNKKA